MNPDQRRETLALRRLRHHPQHSPRHHKEGKGLYLITSTCYEHQPWIGASELRMDRFSSALLEVLGSHTNRIDAWVVLTNHYHAVVQRLGKLHGRTSFQWNGEDETRGMKVWFNTLEREISGDAHHIAAIHYVHHNPVKHGWVKKWDEWKWSSAAAYLERLGREEVERRWKEYPLLNFGAGWDD